LLVEISTSRPVKLKIPPIKLLFVEIENSNKKLLGICVGEVFPRIVAEKSCSADSSPASGVVLVKVHFDSHPVLDVNQQIARVLSVESFNQRKGCMWPIPGPGQ